MKPLLSAAAFITGLAIAGMAHAQCPAGEVFTVVITDHPMVTCLKDADAAGLMTSQAKKERSKMPRLFEASAIPYDAMRYATAGDWAVARHHKGIYITVARLPDPRYEFLVALHELIEARLCQERGITQQAVDAWDMSHQEADEPGEVEGAPYFAEHAFASKVERMMAEQLGVDWTRYEAAIEELGK